MDPNIEQYLKNDADLGLLLASKIAKLMVNPGYTPDKATSAAMKDFTSPDGKVLVSKAQVRKAAAEAMNLVKTITDVDYDGKIVISEDFSPSVIPSDSADHMRILRAEVESWDSMEGMGFGIYDLDRAFGGLYPGEVMAIVGAPGSMKTSLALNAVDDYLERYNDKCLFFSLDMPARTIQARRMIRVMNCFQSELYELIKNKDPRVEEAQKKIIASDRGRFKLIGKPKGGKHYSWDQIRDITIQVAPELLIIDYLTLIGSYRNELEAVYDLIPKIKGLADDFGIAVMMLSQMGRSSRAAQKGGSGGHAAGGHYVEDAADVEIELLKEDTDDYTPAIVATVTKTRKSASGGNYALGFIPRTLSFKATTTKVERAKAPTKIFNI